MLLIAKLVMVALALYGIALYLNKKMRDDLLEFVKTRKGLNIIASGRIVIGALFLHVSPETRVPGLTTILGILLIIAGIVAFIIKKDLVNKYADWWKEKPEEQQQLMGIVPVAIGLIVLIFVL